MVVLWQFKTTLVTVLYDRIFYQFELHEFINGSESIGDLPRLRFLSLRGCTNLVETPKSINDKGISYNSAVKREHKTHEVELVAKNTKAKAKAPLTLQHPFYLSFKTEEAEETFNLPLGLDMDMHKIDTSEHLFRLSTCIKE
ncbi:hypothetical protein HN51_043669 [Arachis hypogaea]